VIIFLGFMMKTKRIGFDYHGVITANPALFSHLTYVGKTLGYEVHILTGSRIREAFMEELRKANIYYTHLFSISDYHHLLGTPMTGYEEGQPKIEGEIWDKTKADYCRVHQIDIHIDDSKVYGKYFTTPYLLYEQNDKEVVFKVFNQDSYSRTSV
jgi:hypothetical protein